MLTALKVVVLILMLPGESRAGEVFSQWVGSYSYQHVMAHAVADPAPAWVFNLMIKRDGGCELTWEGYQKDEDISCEISANSDRLEVYYKKFARNDELNLTKFKVYRPGDKLMELRAIKGSERLITKWGALNRSGVLRNGVRFERD